MWLISGTPALPLDIFVKRCKIERHDAPRLGVLISVSRRLYRAVLSCVKQESLSVLRHSQLSPLLLLPDLMESNAWINKTPAPKCRLLFLARNARPLSKAAIATREATYCAGRCCSDKQEMVVLETLKQHFERNPPLMPRISTKKAVGTRPPLMCECVWDPDGSQSSGGRPGYWAAACRTPRAPGALTSFRCQRVLS